MSVGSSFKYVSKTCTQLFFIATSLDQESLSFTMSLGVFSILVLPLVYVYKKRGSEDPLELCEFLSHEVENAGTSVVDVGVGNKSVA